MRTEDFSRDGKWLASGSVDTTVRIWDAKGRSLVAVLKGHTHQVTSVAFGPGGKWIPYHVAYLRLDRCER